MEILYQELGARLYKTMSHYQHGNSHDKNDTVSRPSYLDNGIPEYLERSFL